MNKSSAAEHYYNSLLDSDRQSAGRVVALLEEDGCRPEEILFDVIVPSIERMMQEFLHDRIILSQHYISVKISEELIDRLLPGLSPVESEPVKVVLGTAVGDFHGLGKKLVGGVLKAHMMQVIDLGVNIPPGRFVEEAERTGASVIGISSMMLHTARGDEGVKKVRRIIDESGLSGRVKLIVGGAPFFFHEDLYKDIGADGWAADGFKAVDLIKSLLRAEV